MKSIWPRLAKAYSIQQPASQLQAIASGHINDTYSLRDNQQQWIVQRINHQIFVEPRKVQQNFDRVSNFLQSHGYPLTRLVAKANRQGKTLTQVDQQYWRLINRVENSYTVERVSNNEQAYQGAYAVGLFDVALIDMPLQQIHCVIPNFFDLNFRLKLLSQAIALNKAGRLNEVKNLLAFVEQHQYLADWLAPLTSANKVFPRVVHNDTKISNILFCSTTHKAKSVIDWDTIMHGYWVFDYADMARSFTQTDVPKEQLNNKSELPGIEFERLQALTEGFLSATDAHITATEKQHLLVATQTISLMLGVRFLTDYLNGDEYFKTQFRQHNLQRANTQFNIVKEFKLNSKNWNARLGLN
ncbi:phosphotransferase enzyme family protein [Aliikangiella sp. IMCC44653]